MGGQQCGLGVPALLEAAEAMDQGASCGGDGGGLEVGREEASDEAQYFCPICMLNFTTVHATACCLNYVCSRCAPVLSLSCSGSV